MVIGTMLIKYGSPLKGAYIIDGQDVMFDPHDGKQIKGGFVRDPKFISKILLHA